VSIIDGRVWLILVALIAALAICARLVYVGARRAAAAEHVEHLAFAPPAPVPYGGRFRFVCRICKRPSVITYSDPGEYLAVVTDPLRRRACSDCTATLADLETRATS
jgi:hypothetical protein